MPWRCFWVERTGQQRRWLRRWAGGDDVSCPEMPGDFSYHNAMTAVDDGPETHSSEGYIEAVDVDEYPRADYPKVCECGYEFAEDDHWQVLTRTIYAGEHREEPIEGSLAELPVGAMFRSWWLEPHHVGPDGQSIGVLLPPGGGEHHVWNIDYPSSSGGNWVREGVPPNITAQPSILTGEYHGFIQNGVLTDSLGDRPLLPGPD